MSTRISAAGLSDTGRKRDNNEDRFHCDTERGIFIVADGMGGENAGEKAAETAISVMRARLERQVGTPVERLREAITLANNEIYQLAQSNPEWRGMACVVTAAVVDEDRATIGHVGDSRLYLLSPGEIRKITHDHSPVGEREDAGDLTEEEAMKHPRRNEVFRDVGSGVHTPDDPDFVDAFTIPLRGDQAMVLCSDGLSDLLTSAEIREAVEQNASSPQAAVKALIDGANRAGGKDNVTAILVEQPRYAASFAETTTRTRPVHTETPQASSAPSWFWRSVIGAALAVLAVAAVLYFTVISRQVKPLTTTNSGRPHTMYVGAGASADAATISAALEKANPGDTVMVAPGHYNEQVHLREGVTLVSQHPGAAIVSTELGDAVVIASDLKSGRFSGFKVAGDATRHFMVGVLLRNSNVELDDLDVSGATNAGIEIRGSSSPVLRGNRVSNNPGAGIAIYDDAAPRLVHNLVTHNGAGEHGKLPGIEVRGAATPTMNANTISDNAGGSIWASRTAAASLRLEDNFFGPFRKPAPRTEVRILPD